MIGQQLNTGCYTWRPKMLRRYTPLLLAITLLVGVLAVPTRSTFAWGSMGHQVRIYIADGPSNVVMTWAEVNGMSGQGNPSNWHGYPFSREAKTANVWYAGRINAYIILSNGLHMSCSFFLKQAFSWTKWESVGISVNGDRMFNVGPSSGCRPL